MALPRIDGIGTVHTKKLLLHFGEATSIFHATSDELTRAGLPAGQIDSLHSFNRFAELEKELLFLDKQGIRPLFFIDPSYPQRLLSCKHYPPFLFYQGNADLNAPRILSIVGTRAPTEYGRQITEKLIKELASTGPLIISGLAFGIDGAAHRAALQYRLPTVGILAHGLSYIYPSEHAALSREMRARGGLLTEFGYDTAPENYQFPLRNRIIAGMSDALVVIETGRKGGSLLSVQNAIQYGRKVFAMPGRLTDEKSAGCNDLIVRGQAILLTGSTQLIKEMKWEDTGRPPTPSLFPSAKEVPLSTPDYTLLQLLYNKESLTLDELSQHSHQPLSTVALTLLRLELQGLITALPGKRYRRNR